MSGDHNMNQAKQYRPGEFREIGTQRGIESTSYIEEPEEYKSEIDRQVTEMQSALCLLSSTVETLRQRLKPVMCDRPWKEPSVGLSNTQSPLGLLLQQYNATIKGSCDDIIHIIESLEI